MFATITLCVVCVPSEAATHSATGGDSPTPSPLPAGAPTTETAPVQEAALATGWRHRHRDVSGGWLRPTVFGAVDGLVTNAALIAGVGGGGVSTHAIVLTGLAGLVAGAFSMGPVSTSR